MSIITDQMFYKDFLVDTLIVVPFLYLLFNPIILAIGKVFNTNNKNSTYFEFFGSVFILFVFTGFFINGLVIIRLIISFVVTISSV